MNSTKNNSPIGGNRESGATLLFVIVLITVLALLGVGLYSLIMTSQLNQAEAQKSAKAYYLSESCLRIAASEYKNARKTSTADAATALINLHDSTLALDGTLGNCKMAIYPYWFYVPVNTVIPAGSAMTLYLPGAVPMIEDNGSTHISLSFTTGVTAKLKKKGSTSEVYEFTSASFAGSFTTGSGTATVFTLKTALTSPLPITAGDEFYLGATYTMPSASTSLTAGGTLTLTLNSNDSSALTGQMFPPVNGTIFFDITGVPQIKYDTRTVNTGAKTVTLTNLQAIGTTTLPVTVSASSVDIYMGKSLGIKSEATYGN